MKKRALISVSDKTGVVEFAKGLEALGYEVISTGGTLKSLTDAGVKAISISDITGFPECLDGRVKTLHPSVHAGLLAMRDKAEHMQQLEKLNINTIDVVAVNLYPFQKTIEKPNVSLAEAIENIDIGGPTMLRSAAKNYKGVLVVCEAQDYGEALERLKNNTADDDYRLKMSYKVYRHTARYDSLISNYMASLLGENLPETFTLAFDSVQKMRYGENPHQSAEFYRDPICPPSSLVNAKQLNGKELSYNNINDTDGALALLREFSEPTVVACKHANPCGVCTAKSVYEAYKGAYECDPQSIFGGILACNREIDEKAASEMIKTFLEIIVAPSYTKGALDILFTKKNLRVLELKGINEPLVQGTKEYRRVNGGMLVQDMDLRIFGDNELECVTKRKPTKAEREQLEFAFKVVKHTKSNAIALARDNCSIGIGMGQPSRVWACEQAIEHAGEKTKGAVLASDAFFPFDDCVKAAAAAGITAIIQPGGSVRDADSIKACDEAGIAMLFTGMRHFRH